MKTETKSKYEPPECVLLEIASREGILNNASIQRFTTDDEDDWTTS